MAARPELGTQQRLRERTGLGGGSYEGVTTGTKAATLDTLEKLGSAFGLAPWQLLVPGLDPNRPPALKMPQSQDDFIARLNSGLYALQQEVAAYGNKTVED